MILSLRLSVVSAFALASAQAVDFSHQIAPILKTHCGECHLGAKKKGGLSMNTRQALLEGSEAGEVVKIGDAAASHLLEVITTQDPEAQMPPEGDRVPPDQVALLKTWIDEGLKWEPGFSFGEAGWEPPLRPRTVELPPAVEGRTNPIDRILDAYLAKRGIPRPPALDDASFARRVSLDIVGLLPEPAAFESRERLIADLLADDVGYADHWLTFWNDLLRNDYTGTGFITRGRTQITAWLYRALLENKPYDQFVRELISPTDESKGFIGGIKWRGDVNSSQSLEVQFAQNISQAFLGINMKCASCHDSFIDRWKLEEAYALAAVYAKAPLEIHRCDIPTGEIARAAWIFPEIGKIDPDASQPERLAQLAELMVHPENGRTTRTIVNRLWHRLMGRGIVHPVDAMHTRPWSEDLLDFLAADLAANGHDLKHTIALITGSRAYQSQAAVLGEEPGEDYVFAGPIAKRMTAEQFLDAVWRLTETNPATPSAKVFRFSPKEAANANVEVRGRWIWRSNAGVPKNGELATFRRQFELGLKPGRTKLIVTCDNEYRVFVNGRKIGEDKVWKSPEVFDIGGSLRAGNNEILIVGRNAGGSPSSAGLFAEIRGKLSDGAPFHLETDRTWEWTAQNLDRAGKFAKPPKNWAPAGEVANPPWPSETVLAGLLEAELGGRIPVRASLMANDFLMRSLGRPHREQLVTTRPEQLTTLQAIDLANSENLAGIFQRGAAKLLARNLDSGALVDWLYSAALSRKPSGPERKLALELVSNQPTQQSIEDLLWAVTMLPEFQVIR